MFSLTTTPFPVANSSVDLEQEIEWRVTERTADLAVSRAELQDFIEQTHDLVQSVDLDGHFRFVNRAWCETLGYAAQEVAQVNLFDLIDPARQPAFRESLDRLIATGEAQRVETAFRARDGRSIAVVGSVHLRYERGVPAFTRAVFHDITERQQAEDRLRASEARYCSVVASVNEVVFQTDDTGCWTFLNPSWTELTGFPVDESIGRCFLDYLHPDDREPSLRTFQPLIEQAHECVRHLTRYGRKEGDYRWVEVFARRIRDRSGAIVGTAGTLTDVTERKAAEENIRRQLLAIQSSSEEGIAWIDDAGRYVRVNPALVKMLGCQFDEELQGRDWFSFFKEEDSPLLAGLLRQVKTDGSQYRGRLPGRRVSGQLFPQEISLMAFPDGGFICICRDLTPQTEVGRQLLQNLAREKELAELKSHFVAAARHELRTPLAALSLGIDHLAKYWTALEASQIGENLQTAQAGIKELRGMVEDLVAIGGSEEGRGCSRVTVELVALCREVIDEVAVRDQRRHPLVWHCPRESWSADVDPTLLRHILSNLISNACKFSPQGSAVRIALKIQPDALVFSVADSGIGIPAEDQSRLFEFFFRASNAGDTPGMGLGLMVARRSAEAHGGSIAVVSQAGRGSCFTLTLPPDAWAA